MLTELIKDTDELTNYQGKWKNLWFVKDGSSHLGYPVYDTEQAAKRAADNRDFKITYEGDPTKESRIDFIDGYRCLASELKCSIQMPMGE